MTDAAHAPRASTTASPWIVRFAPLLRPGGHVIDIACGHGRHARFFAARGAQVLAVDRDVAALHTLSGIPGITIRQLDLEAEAWPLAGLRFDAVIVTNYLHRPQLASLIELVAPDGLLLYETFAAGNEAFGRPSNPAFLLARDELAEGLRGRLTLVAFEQGITVANGRGAVVQRVAAVGPDRAWPPELPHPPGPGNGRPGNAVKSPLCAARSC
jgi:SAM-dependent methyltransferase